MEEVEFAPLSKCSVFHNFFQKHSQIVSEYDQEIPRSQTGDKPMAPRGRATHQSPDTRKQTKQSCQLSLPCQDDCKTRMDINERTTNHRTITDSHNGSNNKQQINNRTTALEGTKPNPNFSRTYHCCQKTENGIYSL